MPSDSPQVYGPPPDRPASAHLAITHLASAVRPLLPATVAMLLASCGPPPEPCVDCPDVSGMYVETIPEVPAHKSSCNALYVEGWVQPIQVLQSGADLEVSPLGLTGVLYDDLSVRFASMGVATAAGQAEMEVTGRFSESDGDFQFRGRYKFTRISDKCRISASIRWDPPEEIEETE